ncbi:MAG TPA: hypothetical protein VFN79_11900 [Steroidobacteraceae bacterium]|nr:hypothetical protein [Steroidobacteraceae bacterium]
MFASDRSGSGYDSGLYSADGQWQVDPSDVVTAVLGSSTATYPFVVANAFGFFPGTVKGSLWNLVYAGTRRRYNFAVDLLHVDPGFRADRGICRISC